VDGAGWCSYGANAELQHSPLVTPHAECLALGATPLNGARDYRRLLDQSVAIDELQEIRSGVNGGGSRPAISDSSRRSQASWERRVERTKRRR